MSIVDEAQHEPTPQPLHVIRGSGAGPAHDFEALLGAGNDLWTDDAEFEAFQVALRRWRNQDRTQTRSP